MSNETALTDDYFERWDLVETCQQLELEKQGLEADLERKGRLLEVLKTFTLAVAPGLRTSENADSIDRIMASLTEL